MAAPQPEHRYPLGDNMVLSLGLSVFLVGLGATVAIVSAPEDGGIRVVGALLGLCGLGMLGIGLRMRSLRPRELVLSTESVQVPHPESHWRAPSSVAYRDIARVLVLHAVGETPLLLELHDGTRVMVPTAPGTSQEVGTRLEARRSAAEGGDPSWTFEAWERVLSEGGFGFLAHREGPPSLVASWEDWLEQTQAADDEVQLVTGRPPPSVALGLPQPEVDALLDQVVAAAAAAGLEGPVDRRNLAMVCGRDDVGVLELFSVMRRLVAMDAAERPAALEEHFDRLLKAAAASAELWERAKDLDAVRDALVVELHASDRVGNHGLQRDLGGGVVAVLALDSEHAVTRVGLDMVETWGVPADELFDQAMENRPAPPAQDEGLFRIHVGPLAASQVLNLDAVVETPEGCIVGVPDQDTLVVMDGVLALVMAGEPAAFCGFTFESSHRPVAPHLHIWWKGELHPIPMVQGPDGKPTLVPPPDVFSEAMDALQA